MADSPLSPSLPLAFPRLTVLFAEDTKQKAARSWPLLVTSLGLVRQVELVGAGFNATVGTAVTPLCPAKPPHCDRRPRQSYSPGPLFCADKRNPPSFPGGLSWVGSSLRHCRLQASGAAMALGQRSMLHEGPWFGLDPDRI
jgi:hypothetical protein